MSLYINTRTNEYPRHDGDVALEPDEPWAAVVETPEPEFVEGHLWVEAEPQQIDGVWHRAWRLIEWTPPAEEEFFEEL